MLQSDENFGVKTMPTTISMNEHIDIQIDSSTKLLAERAAAIYGQDLNAYIYSLIRRNAAKTLSQEQKIILTNQQYDNFLQACSSDNWDIPEKVLSAVKEIEEIK